MKISIFVNDQIMLGYPADIQEKTENTAVIINTPINLASVNIRPRMRKTGADIRPTHAITISSVDGIR